MSSPTHHPRTPKRPTAARNAYYTTTPSPPTYYQRSRNGRHTPNSLLNDKAPAPKTRRVAKTDSMVFIDSMGSPAQREKDPLKTFLRQKFRARCLERAAKAREEQLKRRRYSTGHPLCEQSSDGFDEAMDEDDEEDDDAVMQDELFQRIIESSHRRRQHAYRISYALEVGSSFDPDMEDMGKWEEELGACPPPLTSSSGFLRSEDKPPPDLDEEVAAYAKDLAAINKLDDIPDDELFSWSDFEDEGGITKSWSQQELTLSEDDDMCIS
ncbi:hypothetical protein AX15_001746 [Amanita polypyramis BW_CC]|nr:hypothetical protein AX15_001746 [Amanita polypyramis BW_CC]